MNMIIMYISFKCFAQCIKNFFKCYLVLYSNSYLVFPMKKT